MQKYIQKNYFLADNIIRIDLPVDSPLTFILKVQLLTG